MRITFETLLYLYALYLLWCFILFYLNLKFWVILSQFYNWCRQPVNGCNHHEQETMGNQKQIYMLSFLRPKRSPHLSVHLVDSGLRSNPALKSMEWETGCRPGKRGLCCCCRTLEPSSSLESTRTRSFLGSNTVWRLSETGKVSWLPWAFGLQCCLKP